ncbi:VOC family protein [Sphingomonas sp. MG17]|uniref:VOC family protein n=1 Tax=Sphingomonas tagetis TaxID=2949092 RepID=A0A9X2KP74_9SPHN|nr:VOC family protein [Sphingomonas tagetis]MCP3730333.1 VOC family protein [Sphingomonas tagetis]
MTIQEKMMEREAGQGPAPGGLAKPENPGLTPVMLNHAAWVTHDVEATADFYTRVMGMELASTVYDDSVPSTGDAFPYFHIFFRMQDGSTIAFFEAPDLPRRPEVTHPAYDIFDHIALEATNREEVDRWHDWLVKNEIDVVGPTDHKGLIYSIYFHDPNGMRLEITTPIDSDWNKHTEQGRKDLKLWCDAKNQAAAENRNVATALVELIRDQRKRYEAT